MDLLKIKSYSLIAIGIVIIICTFFSFVFSDLQLFIKSNGVFFKAEGWFLLLLGTWFVGYGVSIKVFNDEDK